jgi:hypothetical protein
MFTKKRFPVQGLFLGLCIFISCRQPVNTVSDEPVNMRIPVPVKDSMLSSIDRSPMDMSYFPEDYPKQKMITPNLDNPLARVIYSRPQKNNRVIFGDSSATQNIIQRYGREWRLGANEATEIEFFKPVSIKGKNIPRGRYIMYCIPYPGKWEIILNENLFSWGLHIDKSKDVASIELPVTKNTVELEYYTMLFQNAPYGCDLVMAWGNIKVTMPVSFK